MAIEQIEGDLGFLTQRRAGDQPQFDIKAIARELTHSLNDSTFSATRRPPRVLFDWAEVTSWPYKVSSQKCVQFWKEAVPPILRAAFIHDKRWDRQAAILGALLRMANTEARSFSPARLAVAVSWLASAQNSLPDDGTPTKSAGSESTH
jgi:hypothetical protein